MKYTFKNGKTIEMSMEQALKVRDGVECDDILECQNCPLYPGCRGFSCMQVVLVAGIICSTEGGQE